MNTELIELYSDFLIAHAGQTSATALSLVSDHALSHDQVTRFLSGGDYSSKHLWKLVKPMVRRIQTDDACLIFDDTIQEKNWMDENDIICWHFDHCSNRSVKGINLLNALYHSQDVSIPVAFEIVKKTQVYLDKDGRTKRRSETTKNEMMREMIKVCLGNDLKFRYVLMDSWFAATENFEYITSKGKHFIAALKDNRLVALSEEDRKMGRFTAISSLELPEQQAVRCWLNGYDKQVIIVRRTFTNKDGSKGVLDLVCSDLELEGAQVVAIYQKRWKVEQYHKSLKSNASLGKSPARSERTQSNHVFMSIYAVFKLECMRIKYNINHFALRARLLTGAFRLAFAQLRSGIFA